MKNYEKYAEEIKSLQGVEWCNIFAKRKVLEPIGRLCENTNCGLCQALTSIWLMEEYKEPETDWSKVEVDTPILVRDGENNEWQRFYFAKYEDGFVYTWIAGATSWTAVGYEEGGNVYKWKYAKLAEDEGDK